MDANPVGNFAPFTLGSLARELVAVDPSVLADHTERAVLDAGLTNADPGFTGDRVAATQSLPARVRVRSTRAHHA
jgi:hypothetical protein